MDKANAQFIVEFDGLSGAIPTAFTYSAGIKEVVSVTFAALTSTTEDYFVQLDNISFSATGGTLSTNSVVASKFAVFPNPSNGSEFVNFTGDNIQATGASVFNLLGKEVLKVSQNELANKQINISTLAKGLYLLNIETNEGVVTKKIIKN